MGNVLPKGPVRPDIKTRRNGGSNRIAIRKKFDAKRKRLTETYWVELTPVNIL